MYFKSEQDLQLELFTMQFKYLGMHSIYFTRREVRVGECIPDLVSVHFDDDPSFHEWPKRWTYKHSFTIWLLKKWGQLKLDEIASFSYSNVIHTQGIVDDLLKNEIASRKKTGEIILSPSILNMQTDVVAIEAKLKNWRQAFSQARRYQSFADIVIVAMDATYAPRDKEILKQFSDQKIGLCAISPGSQEWLTLPEQRTDLLGHEKEYLVMSAAMPSTQILWDKRNILKASSQD